MPLIFPSTARCWILHQLLPIEMSGICDGTGAQDWRCIRAEDEVFLEVDLLWLGPWSTRWFSSILRCYIQNICQPTFSSSRYHSLPKLHLILEKKKVNLLRRALLRCYLSKKRNNKAAPTLGLHVGLNTVVCREN